MSKLFIYYSAVQISKYRRLGTKLHTI